jgi:hypothetical protein
VIADMPPQTFRDMLVPGGLLYDMKIVFPVADSDVRL